VVERGVRARIRAGLGELDGRLDLSRNGVLHGLDRGVVEDAVSQQPGPEQLQRIALAPFVDLRLVPVGALRQPERVIVEPVRLGLDQRRAFTPPGARHRLADRLVDGHDVLPVHGDPGDAVAGRPGRDIRHRHHQAGRAQLPVAVVLADVHHGQAPDRRQVEALVERSLIGRAVAEEAQGHPVGALHLRAERVGQPGQDEVNDGHGVAVRLGGQLGPLGGRAEDHPDDDRPVEAVEQEVHRGVGRKVAAIDGPAQQCPGPLDVRDGDLAGEPGLQGGDDGGLQVDPQERPSVRAGLALQQPGPDIPEAIVGASVWVCAVMPSGWVSRTAIGRECLPGS